METSNCCEVRDKVRDAYSGTLRNARTKNPHVLAAEVRASR
jgi:hypothetical protein